MSTKKIYDLAVVNGTYIDKSGVTKNKYKNIGVELEKDDGSRFILMDRDFNPAGVPFDASKGDNKILVSKFAPRPNNGQPGVPQYGHAPEADDIPF